MTESKKGPLPLVVGFTGHRDLKEEDIPILESHVRAILLDLQTRFPCTPIVILSALAEGADRIGARLALECGFKLIVPLPMPRTVYEKDFSHHGKVEFTELMAKATHCFELPLPHGVTHDALAPHGAARNYQYAAGGAYIAMNCQILIALWNGHRLNLVGGTSQTVAFKLEGVPEPYAPKRSELDAPESGPVYHIVTPRKSHPEVEGRAHSLHKRYPVGFRTVQESEKAYDDIYGRVEEFNRDAVRLMTSLEAEQSQSKDYVLPAKQRTHLTPRERSTLDLYAVADVLSQRYQRDTLWTLRNLLGMVFVSATAFDLYAHFFEEEKIVLAIYLLGFLIAFGWNYRAERASFQSKYLDYRALAEGLRVQFFWQIAGLKDSVAEYYLSKQKSELDWIRHAVRATMTETEDDPNLNDENRPGEIQRLEIVERHWVEDQMKYFTKAAHRDHHKYHRNERIITWMFGSSIALAILQIVMEPSKVMISAIGILPVVGAIVHTYTHKNALAEHTKQYERMAVLFRRAKEHLRKIIATGHVENAKHFVGELGREALIENGDWIVTHRERPLEVPKGA